jgi:hypothetical protein
VQRLLEKAAQAFSQGRATFGDGKKFASPAFPAGFSIFVK